MFRRSDFFILLAVAVWNSDAPQSDDLVLGVSLVQRLSE